MVRSNPYPGKHCVGGGLNKSRVERLVIAKSSVLSSQHSVLARPLPQSRQKQPSHFACTATAHALQRRLAQALCWHGLLPMARMQATIKPIKRKNPGPRSVPLFQISHLPHNYDRVMICFATIIPQAPSAQSDYASAVRLSQFRFPRLRASPNVARIGLAVSHARGAV